MIKNLPLISVIIPVYNVEAYLKQCLESVVHQTYCQLEVILVDDGSTDGSGLICDEYARIDKRFIVIHQENRGLSQARNRGIDIARGEYITFIDSDDWVDVEYCEVLLTSLFEYGTQSAMCAYLREYPNNSLPRVLHPNNVIWEGKNLQRRICGPIGEELRRPEFLDCYVTMWGKLYPYEAVRGIKVVDTYLIGTEDALYNLEALNNIKTMLYITKPLYHYRKGLETSLTSRHNPYLENRWDHLYERMLNVIETNKFDDIYISALNNRIALNIIGIAFNCIYGNESFAEKYKRIKHALSHNRRSQALKNLPLRHMPIHWKLFFFCVKCKLAFILYVMMIVIRQLKGKI